MAVYYKFMSARDFDCVPFDGPFISVADLKQKIFESKYISNKNSDSKYNNSNKNYSYSKGLCFGTDLDLLVTNAQTNEDYLDDTMLIPKNSSVLIRRVPGGRRRKPIDISPIVVERDSLMEESSSGKSTVSASISMSTVTTACEKDKAGFGIDDDDFGGDVYAIPVVKPIQHSLLIGDPVVNKEDDDESSRIKALVSTPALDWQHQSSNYASFGNVSRSHISGMERKIPPKGYVCYRCNMAGHYIQYCPTNGDPNYDFKRARQPSGIPKSMLTENPSGFRPLSGGAAAVLQPDEAAFEKEIQGLSSKGSAIRVANIPPELLCTLCKQVMRDAVLCSKCCFRSFCHKCIRDYIMKSNCVCGANNTLADDLIPNVTLRDTISHILESGMVKSSSSENSISNASKISSTTAIPSKQEQKPMSGNIGGANIDAQQLQMVKRAKTTETTDVSEAVHESSVKKEAGLAGVTAKNVQQKLVFDGAEIKKGKKRTLPCLESESYMMPMGSFAYPN